jgi:chitinase
LAFYGRSFKLGHKDNNKLGAPIKVWDGGPNPGPYTNASGFLSYYEICNMTKEEQWTMKYDDVGKVPYAFKNDQWVGYEDADSIAIKVKWLKDKGYGGAMIWAVDMDDFNTMCGPKNVLIKTIHGLLKDYTVPEPPPPITTTRPTWWRPPTTTQGTTTTTTPYTGPPTSPTTRAPLPEGQPDCSKGQEYYPHKDCTKYWRCIRNEAHEYKCQNGLHFNPLINNCDWPKNVNRDDCVV